MQIIPEAFDRKGWSRVKDGEKIIYMNDENGEIIITNIWQAAGIDPITYEETETIVLKDYQVV